MGEVVESGNSAVEAGDKQRGRHLEKFVGALEETMNYTPWKVIPHFFMIKKKNAEQKLRVAQRA